MDLDDGDNDFKPEDGWELVYMDLGVDSDGSPLSGRSGHIWFVLYNRYRSFMRFFVAIADQIGPHQMLEIELSFEPGGYYSALFSSLDKVQKPLRYFNNSIIGFKCAGHITTRTLARPDALVLC